MLTTLRKIIENVLKENDIIKALKILVKESREALGVDCCSIYLDEPSRCRYRLVATDGLFQDSEGKVTLRYGEGLVGLVGRRKELLNLADAQNHPNFKYIPEIGEEEFQSFLGVPIEHAGIVLGIFIIQQKESRQFTDVEESFLVTLSAQLASILYLSDMQTKDQDTHEPISCTFGSGGIAIARGWVWQPHMELNQVILRKTDDPEMQSELFHQAMYQLQTDLDSLILRMKDSVKKIEHSEVFENYQRFLDEDEFSNLVDEKILSENWAASAAVKIISDNYIETRLNDDKKEEALAIKDLAQRLLSRLAHSYLEDFDFKEPVVLLAENVTASLIAEVPRDRLAGLVSLNGSENSIAAILAKSLNIPILMGVNLPLQDLDRHLFIIDGKRKELHIDPSIGVVIEYQGNVSLNEEKSRLFDSEKSKEVITEDGVKINVDLNAGINFEEEQAEVLSMIDGVGLYRTEIEYMMHNTFPTELEECAHYENFLQNFSTKRVRMRTLDVGGDKPLPYLPLNEENPFMGWRGIRISLDRPNLLLSQFRAMLKANRKYENLEIMLPMVSSLDEVIQAKALLDQAHKEICEEYSDVVAYPKLGAMIEVPAVMFLLEDLAPYCDYFSIGSNDLTQYVLAVDRNNPSVAKLYDCFQPAMVRVLHRLHRICEHEINRPLAMCGEMAGSPLGALLLVSIGYRELSMNMISIPEIKYILRRVNTKELSEVFAKAIKLSSATEIRKLYVEYAQSKGLGNFVDIKH
ncbi:MAG: phosphoenolpyruvate--protein phosphotransferase [Succinivibrionaceae bacterium]